MITIHTLENVFNPPLKEREYQLKRARRRLLKPKMCRHITFVGVFRLSFFIIIIIIIIITIITL